MSGRGFAHVFALFWLFAGPAAANPFESVTPAFYGSRENCIRESREVEKDERREFIRACMRKLAIGCKAHADFKRLKGQEAIDFRVRCVGRK